MSTEEVVDVPEVVEAEETKALTKVEGKTFGILKDALASFSPNLTEDMPIEIRRDAVRKALDDSKSLDDKVYLVRGELLYEVYENEYWKSYTYTDAETGEELPYSKFEQYAKEELNISKRTALYLTKIYRKCVAELNLPTEILQDLEWSKVKEVVDHLTEDNYTDMLDKVSSMTLKEAIEYGRVLNDKPPKTPKKGTSGKDPDEKFVKKVFNLSPEQLENVNAALEMAQSFVASDSEANQLDLICSDFVGSNTSGADEEGGFAKLEQILQSIRRTWKVEVEVTGRSDDGPIVEDDEDEDED